MGHRGSKEGEHGVPDELVQRPLEPEDHGGQEIEELVEECPERLERKALNQGGEVSDVREQDCDGPNFTQIEELRAV